MTTGEKFIFTSTQRQYSVGNVDYYNDIVREDFILKDKFKPEIIKTRNSDGWYWLKDDYNDSDPNARELSMD